MAGVPKIMQAMLDNIAPLLNTGKAMLSRTVKVHIGEGDIAAPLEAIQTEFSGVSIGSYPFEDEGRFASNIVLRSKDESKLEMATSAVEKMAETLKTKTGCEGVDMSEGKQDGDVDDRYQKGFPVSWEQLHRDGARALAWRLSDAGPFTGVVAVTRGGLVPAAIVARELGDPGHRNRLCRIIRLWQAG